LQLAEGQKPLNQKMILLRTKTGKLISMPAVQIQNSEQKQVTIFIMLKNNIKFKCKYKLNIKLNVKLNVDLNINARK
jgi:hypothetical protein